MRLTINKTTSGIALLATALLVLALEAVFRPSPRPDAPSPAAAQALNAVDPAPARPVRSGADLTEIAGWHLFGRVADGTVQPESPPETPAVNPDDLPDTSLTLTLVGVFSSEDKPYAWVIIEAPGVGHRRYTVGDTLPGGAVIDAILRKAVVLDQNGKKEALRLRNRASSNAGPAALYPNLPVPQTLPENELFVPPAEQE
jgi:type II secretory pathway component PulC